MKAFFKKLAFNLLLIILIPILLLAGLWLLLMTPFDYIRYKRSPYFKDFRKKYTFAVCYNDTYRLYNLIKKCDIPKIVFHPKENTPEPVGYFTLYDILLVCDLASSITYDRKKDAFCLIAPEPEGEDDTNPPFTLEDNEEDEDDGCLTIAKYADILLEEASAALPDTPLTRCIFLYGAENESKKQLCRIDKEPLLWAYHERRRLPQAIYDLVLREMDAHTPL